MNIQFGFCDGIEFYCQLEKLPSSITAREIFTDCTGAYYATRIADKNLVLPENTVSAYYEYAGNGISSHKGLDVVTTLFRRKAA